MNREFPSNSQTRGRTPASSPRDDEKRERVQRVVQGPVTRRKKPMGRKVVDMFGGDARGAGSYVVLDILVPAAKDAIVDGFTMWVEHLVLGGPRRRGGGIFRQGPVTQRVNYQQPASTSIRQNAISPRGRANFHFDEILLSSRVEADEVLATLIEHIEKYGQVTVRDLYDAIGEESKWTEVKYGWVDLSYAQVRRARGGGYILDLPKPEPLE